MAAKSDRKDFSQKVLDLISFLEAQEEAYHFLKPVDYKALNLENYPLVIKRPMDLSTVKKRVKAGRYSDYGEALTDLNLIWENCRTYNQAGSQIVDLANAMEQHQRKYSQKHKISRHKRPREQEVEFEPRQLSDVISFEEKVGFSEQVRRISQETLTAIIELIQTDCPQALEELDSERMQIKVDLLDRANFSKIFEVVSSSLKADDPANKRPKLR